MKLHRTGWVLSKWCAGCLRDILLGTLWLCLCGLLTMQIGLVASHRLPLPPWMLRTIEGRLTSPGLRVQIESASVDPAGRVLINNLQLAPPLFDSPLVRIDELYLRLNLLALLHRKIEPGYIRASGINLLLPAMLSPTGRNEEVLSNVCISLKPGQATYSLDQLSGQMANLTFSARGPIAVPTASWFNKKPTATSNLTAEAIKAYIEFARRVTEFAPDLAALDAPHLDLRLTATGGTPNVVSLILTSRRADIDLTRFRPGAGRLQVADLHLATTLALSSKPPVTLEIQGTCAEASTTEGYRLHRAKAVLTGKAALNPASFTPLGLVVSAESARANDIDFENAFARLARGKNTSLDVELTTEAIGTSWQVEGNIDPKPGQGTFAVDGAITPFIVQLIEQKTGMPPDTLLKQLGALAPVALFAEFSDGWKLRETHGRLAFGPVVAYKVPLSGGHADFSYDGTELSITNIIASQGENATDGSYWMNTKTKEFRFLLNGCLRPMGIAGWFEDWWTNFWSNFDFAPSAPVANVDVAGRWGSPYTTTVFVTADVARPTIRNIPFDRVRTTMFIRPDFYDALELMVDRDGRSARGTFTRSVDFYRATDSLRTLDFDLTSNLDIAETAKLFGDEGVETVEPFTFANPPSLHLSGHVAGAAAAGGPHRSVQIALKSTGAFSLYDFPLNDLSFDGTIEDHDIDLRAIRVSFASGQAQGKAFLSGPEAERQLSFDCALTGATIGEAISTLEQFSARQRGELPSATSRFQQKISEGHLNLQLSAQGLYHDPLSFQGHGALDLSGAQLAQINLLGALSQVLSKSSLFSFTALQLNEARSGFTLDRNKIYFPDLRITGNAAIIEAKGTYLLDKKLMDFAAKVYPFAHGKTLLANAASFVFVPLSNALELKLSGKLDQPNWRFTLGPTNLLYNITGTKPGDAEPPDQPSTDKSRRLPPPYLRR